MRPALMGWTPDGMVLATSVTGHVLPLATLINQQETAKKEINSFIKREFAIVPVEKI